MSRHPVLPLTIEINSRRHQLAWVLVLLLAYCQYTATYAQQPQPILTHYEVDDGLPSSELHHVMQDSKGYMWFATDMGVSRFDGYKFQNFSFSDGMPDNTIFNIYEDPKGRIWFISFSGRLSIYENGIITAYKYNAILKREIADLFKGSFRVDKNDNVLIATSWYGYITIDNQGKLTHYKTDSLYHTGITLIDSNEVFVYGGLKKSNVNIIEINGIASSELEVPNLDSRSNFRCIRLQNNDILLASGRVVTLIKNLVSFTNYTLSHDALSVYQDHNTSIWIGTYQGGVYYYENGLGKYPTRNYLAGLSITSITQDHEGGFWLATLEDGLYYLASNEYLTYNRETGLNGDKVTTLASDFDATVFVGLRSGSLHTIEDSILSHVKFNTGVLPAILTLYYDTSTFSLWVGAPGKDLVVDQSGVSYLSGLGGSHTITKNIDGKIWQGNHRGLKLRADTSTVYSSIMHQDAFRVSVVHEDQQGDIWIGNLDGLWKFQDSTFVSAHESSPLLSFRISDIDEILGTLCLATRGAGLLILQNDSIIQINGALGLSSDNVNDIWIDGNDIWLATNKGVNQISIADIDPFSYRIRTYSRGDGLASDEVNKVMKFKNQVWAATNKGLTFFDPDKIYTNKKGPNIYIDKVKVYDRDTSLLDSYDLSYDQNQLTIYFTALSYKTPEHLQYRIKMEGIDSTWVLSENTSARYTSMPPGSYTFTVTAQNHDGFWSEKAASFSLVIHPPFWETWWFRLTIALGIAGAIYAFFKIRVLTYNRDVVRELMIALLNKFRKIDYLVVKIDSKVVRIAPRSILWIKAAENYVEIVTKDQKYLVRSTLTAMLKDLPEAQNFLQVHRSYIIHLLKVNSVDKNAVKVSTETIPVSESYKDNLQIVKEHLLLMKK